MKKKTIWSLALALALVVSAIGASTAALAAAPDTAEPALARMNPILDPHVEFEAIVLILLV